MGLSYLTLFGGIAFAGVYLLVTAMINAAFGLRSKSWPTTDGTITSASIDWQEGSPGSGESIGEAESYRARVKYQYQVNGVSFESKRLRFGFNIRPSYDVFFSLRAAQRQMSDYLGGKTVKVYYHPQKPQISTLQPGLKLAAMWFCFFGLLVLRQPSQFSKIHAMVIYVNR